jgi:hypothetical protein
MYEIYCKTFEQVYKDIQQTITSMTLVRMTKRFGRVDQITNALFLQARSKQIDICVVSLTKTFNSGNPPSILRSYTSFEMILELECSSDGSGKYNHILKRPPVSSESNGINDTELMAGGGKVSISSTLVLKQVEAEDKSSSLEEIPHTSLLCGSICIYCRIQL